MRGGNIYYEILNKSLDLPPLVLVVYSTSHSFSVNRDCAYLMRQTRWSY